MKLTTDFSLAEFACHDAKLSPVPGEYYRNVQNLAGQLQILRDYLGEPIQILSGYRTPEHNRKIGGAPKSQHITASAADICVRTKSPRQLAAIVERLILKGALKIGGLGIYPSWIHVDVRKTKARW